MKEIGGKPVSSSNNLLIVFQKAMQLLVNSPWCSQTWFINIRWSAGVNFLIRGRTVGLVAGAGVAGASNCDSWGAGVGVKDHDNSVVALSIEGRTSIDSVRRGSGVRVVIRGGGSIFNRI